MMALRAFNCQAAFEMICYFSFAAAMFYLAVSGKYLAYVTPRMQPYLYFTAAVMLIWGLSVLPGCLRLQYRQRISHCIIFILPILLLLLPYSEMNMAALPGNSGLLTGNSVSGALNSTNVEHAANTAAATLTRAEQAAASEAAAAITGAPDAYMSTNAYGKPLELHGYDGNKKTISVANEEFYSWGREFLRHLDRFEGFQVTMTGFVFKNSAALAADEFVPARLLMSCCVADLTPYGIICHYDQAGDLKNHAWVTVTGVLFKGKFQGHTEPQLQITAVTPAQPVDGYVYQIP